MAYDPRRQSRAAQRLAEACKARANYQCEQCGSAYRIQAHHVRPLHTIPDLDPAAYDLDNLQCLCWDCHKRKHRRARDYNPWFRLLYLRQYGRQDAD